MGQTDAASRAEAERLSALAELDLVELGPTFERVGRLVRAFSGLGGDVVLMGAERTWRAGGGGDSTWGQAVPVAISFAAATVAADEVLWVADAQADPRFAGHPDVTAPVSGRFYAGAPVRLADGARVGVVCVRDAEPRPYDPALAAVLVDLAAVVATECAQHRAQKALTRAAENEAQAGRLLATFVEVAPVALCMTDRDLRVLRASPRWRQERQQADPVGLTLYESNPDTRRFAPFYDHCLAGNTVQHDRVPITLPDGTARWVRVEITPWRDSEGEVGGLLIMSVDVTRAIEALEQAEHAQERLQLALEIGQLHMWEMDFKQRRLASAGAGGIAAVTFDQLNADIWSGIHPADREMVRVAWDEYLAGGAPFRQSYRILQKDGPHQWYDSACEAVRDEDGEILRVIGVLRNIDAQKRAELELTKAKDAAEAANKAKSEFLANMSHEIRTPLNGVMGIAGALARTELSAPQGEMVSLIETSAQTLEALLTDILDLARIEAGRLEIRPEPFDMVTSANACAALFQASAAAKDIDLRVEVDPYAHGAFEGDAPRIRQILSNLLGNAVKFTAKGEVTLAVRARRDETTTHLVFEVSDTGIGFDAETHGRLFGRFQQADGSITRQYGGTGLGLAISRSLAEAMGGSLTAESAPGAGSTFRLTLELARRTGAVEMWGEHEAAAEDEANLDAMRVLLAEDHPTNRRVVELILGAAGVDLTSVENGAEAVDMAARSRFDLILMDMQMPVMDGLTAIRAIRRREAREGGGHTPIYTLTANAMPEHAQASDAAGADGHVTKPITADGLLRVVEQVWADRGAAQAAAKAANG